MVAESSASRLDDEDLLFISYSSWGDQPLLWACERGRRWERQSKHSAAAETWTLANSDRGWLLWPTLNEQKYQDPCQQLLCQRDMREKYVASGFCF